MKALLCAADLWEYVLSDCPERDLTTANPPVVKNLNDILLWQKKDRKALSQIILCLDDNQLNLVKKAETSKEAWNLIKDYHQKSTACSIAIVLKKIYALRLEEGGDAEKHLFTMEELYDRLSALGTELPEIVKAVTILISLPDSYKALGSAMGALAGSDLTVNTVKSKVLDEFQKIQECPDTQVALKVSSFTCNYCKQPGHIQRNCWKLNSKLGSNQEGQKIERSNLCFSSEDFEKAKVVVVKDFSF